MDQLQAPFVHESALVEQGVKLGAGVRIWHFVQIRTGAELGDFVSLGKDSYVDADVKIGRGTRIQNQVNIFSGVHVKDWVFVGPSVVFTNDQFPRVGNKSWTLVDTVVENGASIGAGAIIRCGIKLGAFCMIGAGALVTKDVAPFTLVIGHPAGETKKICACGQSVLTLDTPSSGFIRECCQANMNAEVFELAKAEVLRL